MTDGFGKNLVARLVIMVVACTFGLGVVTVGTAAGEEDDGEEPDGFETLSEEEVEKACDAAGGIAWGTQDIDAGGYGCVTDNILVICEGDGTICDYWLSEFRQPTRDPRSGPESEAPAGGNEAVDEAVADDPVAEEPVDEPAEPPDAPGPGRPARPDRVVDAPDFATG